MSYSEKRTENIGLMLTKDELDRIDDHWHENRFKNRTAAVRDLIEKGFEYYRLNETSKTNN